MAKAAIDNEELGKDPVTDFLAVSFSSPDYIGHRFGINAIEIEDTYLRLDTDLANLFTHLDAKVGKGAYTVFLTADHGAAHNPSFLMDNKVPAGTWSGGELQRNLNTFLQEKYNAANLVTSFSNSQVHFNNMLLQGNKLNEELIRKDVVQFLRGRPQIAFVADVNNIEEAALPEELKNRVINGYNSKRSGPIVFILEPGWYSGAPNATGTTHGSWNAYDAHIPLLWMGWGIKHGTTTRQTHMTDIAATLAGLLRIQMPNGCIGKTIEEVFKKAP
jgi:predicted AlkP superfamily pyrophosphatase or phosphodiesterase